MVATAQVGLLLPAMLFMLIGGVVSDRVGGQRVAVIAQSLAVIPPLYLATTLALDMLTFNTLLIYAVSIGTLQAFVTPARDGLLNHIARGNIQRTVSKATLAQFLVQMIGFSLASQASRIGGVPILLVQAAVVAAGAVALAKMEIPTIEKKPSMGPWLSSMIKDIAEGARTVWSDVAMRLVIIQNLALGICFMGSYIVTIPILIRDRYAGDSMDLGFVSLFNSTGLVITILTLLLVVRRINRPGLALLLAHGFGALILASGGFELSFSQFVLMIFLWGACGGIAMSMARTIMQEQAPENQRARVMSFFGFSFMGSGPIGALIWGFAIEALGAGPTLTLASLCMLTVVCCVVGSVVAFRLTARVF